MPLRVIFMGTPEFSVPTLQAIIAAGHEVVAVYTQPPRPAGRRGLELTKSPVHLAAEELGVEVRAPVSLRDEAEQKAFRALRADVAIVVAYGLLLPEPILDAPRLGCYNAHASLLPRWRGAAPIQRAIEAGDAETGVMVMKMEEGLDTGPVAMVRKVAIGPYMTASELHDQMMDAAARMTVDALAALEKGFLTLTPQAEDGITYARKIEKTETRLDWTRPAREVHDKIRGFSPLPGTWTEMTVGSKPERVKLLRAIPGVGSGAPGELLDDRLTVACGTGAAQIMELQRAGGKPLTAEEFLRGAKLPKGARLT